jgi:hypothetical protein
MEQELRKYNLENTKKQKNFSYLRKGFDVQKLLFELQFLQYVICPLVCRNLFRLHI